MGLIVRVAGPIGPNLDMFFVRERSSFASKRLILDASKSNDFPQVLPRRHDDSAAYSSRHQNFQLTALVVRLSLTEENRETYDAQEFARLMYDFSNENQIRIVYNLTNMKKKICYRRFQC